MRAAFALGALSILVVALATLWPAPGESSTPPPFCLVCGPTGLADTLRNVVLFVPLGVGIALGRRRPWHAAAAGFALSCVVESLQLVTPGRDPSARDVVANTMGAAIGAVTVRSALRFAHRPAHGAAPAMAITALVIVAAAQWLQTPSFPRAAWFGGYTADLGHFEHYQGRVLTAAIGDAPLGEARIPDDAAEALRAALLAGATWRVEAIAGPAPMRLAPLISIHDEAQREILLLGVIGDSLLVRERHRSADLLLEAVDTRVDDILHGVHAGDSLSIEVRTGGETSCVSAQGRLRCVASRPPARGWALFASVTRFSERGRAALDATWLALLALPIGFLLRPAPSGALAALIWIGGLALMPGMVGSMEPSVTGVGGAIAGVLAGSVIAGVVRKRTATPNGVNAMENR